MTNLHEKLIAASEHIRLTAEEKRTMRAALFGAPDPVAFARSPYVFVASHRWAAALAVLVLVVGAGGGTAFAAQGALPGSPLYAVKVKVVEPAQLALASGPAQKAAVNAQIAQTRVEEAEALAQRGALDAATTQALALNFEAHAASAEALAEETSASDPVAAVQVKAQLGASASAGGEVLAALGGQSADEETKQNAAALSVRVLARAPRQSQGHDVSAVALAAKTAAPAPQQDAAGESTSPAAARSFAFAPAPAPATTTTATTAAPADVSDAPTSTENEDDTPRAQAVAASLEQKAQKALDALQAQLEASSTLNASSRSSLAESLTAIQSLMNEGADALNAAHYSTATDDFTQALGKALRLSVLLAAQQKFDTHVVESLFSSGGEYGSHGDDSGGLNLHF
jgi:hypothetical protein